MACFAESLLRAILLRQLVVDDDGSTHGEAVCCWHHVNSGDLADVPCTSELIGYGGLTGLPDLLGISSRFHAFVAILACGNVAADDAAAVW
jgi:hypothetical protein